MDIVKGQQAPAFMLYDTGKNKITLHDYRGKNVLLLFFPLAFTSTCTAELCSIRDNIALYNNTNAIVFGISVDSAYTLKKFKEDQGLNFTLLSDFNKTASKAYNVLYDVFPSMEMEGVSKRAAFVIDKDGVVQYAEICAKPADLPNFDEISATLKGLKE